MSQKYRSYKIRGATKVQLEYLLAEYNNSIVFSLNKLHR